jgi:hypothetical protein
MLVIFKRHSTILVISIKYSTMGLISRTINVDVHIYIREILTFKSYRVPATRSPAFRPDFQSNL